MALSPELLSILVCPQCKGELQYQLDPETLDCLVCRQRFPVRDGIPVMLVDEAERIGEL